MSLAEMETTQRQHSSKHLQGMVAVVTGGTLGIGRAIAEKFAAEGAKVCILATNSERGERVAREINEKLSSDHARYYMCDVSNFEATQTLFTQLIEEFGQIDLLVNNAGITRDHLLMKMSEEDWDRVMDVNAKSCFNCCKAVSRSMLKARKGRIINMTSVVGMIGNSGQANYAASKGAMIALTKSLAREFAPRNVVVNAIAPGYISTDMTERLPEGIKEEAKVKIPLGRMGEADEVAELALFLARAPTYITGQCIVIDGGLSM